MEEIKYSKYKPRTCNGCVYANPVPCIVYYMKRIKAEVNGRRWMKMSVVRVEKNGNFTTMSNIHLRDKNLSLKAKGLLSMFLSPPDEWYYSIQGLTAICQEGTDGYQNCITGTGKDGLS